MGWKPEWGSCPKNWKSLNQGSWTRALFELIKCCYLNYITLDEAEDYIEYRTVENPVLLQCKST